MDSSAFQLFSTSFTPDDEQAEPFWRVFSEEQSSAYIIRVVVSAAVLFVLTSEQIHLDPPGMQYRKAVMCCLMVVASLVAASYVGYEWRDLNLQHTSYKLAEAFWVLVNCTVFHFPARILGEPQWKLNCFCYCSIVLVLVAAFVHYFTDFNFAYLANVIVSAYTLVLLVRLSSALRRYGKPLKAAESLVRMEYIILILNLSIVFLTAYARMRVYPIKGTLFVMYWMRIHTVLVEYGREFVPERKADGKEGDGVQLRDLHSTAPSWGKAMGQLSSSTYLETVAA
mmetsp:Transcript_63462/g.118017  ORF Transcript_63462/g.118017 Transcript_63462/m.118017 type:complete len:283 (+) Transcript_63462:55-903(+)